MSKTFKKLLVPEGYRHYWSKYPEGYTILESLLNWVESVNQLTDNVNDWNIYLVDFVENFDEKLRPTVETMLNEMEQDGRLAQIINDEIFSWKADKTYVDDEIDGLNMQLSETTQDVNSRGINVLHYGAVGDGVTDDTIAIQEALDALEGGGGLILPANKTFIVDNLFVTHDNITISGSGKSSIIKQSPNAPDAPIIKVNGTNFSGNDFRVVGDWTVEKENSDGIYGDNIFYLKGMSFEDINGNAIYNNGRAIITAVDIRHTVGDGIHVGADSTISGVNIGRTGKYGIDLAGSHNAVSGAMLWMCGNNTRVKDTEYGGIRIAGRLNSVVGFTVISSAGHGVKVGGRGHVITGTTTNNGLMAAFDNDKAGLWGRNLSSCVINISASNSVDKPSDGNGTWGWQKYGVELENFNSNRGNTLNVTADYVDQVVKSDVRTNPVNQLRMRNTVNAPQVESRIFTELPSPSEEVLGQIVLLKGSDGEDQAHICIQRGSGQYVWRAITEIIA